MFDNVILDYMASKEPCDLVTIGRMFNKAGYGIALRKGLKYADQFSLEVLKLRQEGVMERLQKDYIYETGRCQRGENSTFL